MVEITVCVGSACHTKGAYHVVKKFQEVIRERGLQDDILLKGSFCLGKCAHGITVKIGENHFLSIETHEVENVINQILNGSLGG